MTTRLVHRRAVAVHAWAEGLLRRRGGLVLVFARYVPGGRSTTTLAAGVVGYPARRFHGYTALGVALWALQAALIGYLGGALFAGRPVLGLLLGWEVALVVTALAVAVQRVVTSIHA